MHNGQYALLFLTSTEYFISVPVLFCIRYITSKCMTMMIVLNVVGVKTGINCIDEEDVLKFTLVLKYVKKQLSKLQI